MRPIKQYIKEWICHIFGHKECYVLSSRPRVYRHKSSWKNRKVKMVRGHYTECARCGKKLTNFKR